MDRRSFLTASATAALLPLAEAPALAAVAKQGSGDAKLNQAFEDRRLREGGLVLMEAMGGGFTWGAVLARW